MKILLFSILIAFISRAELTDLDRELDWSVYTPEEARDFLQSFNFERNKKLIYEIEKAKIYTVYGEVKKSQDILNRLKINYTNENIQRVLRVMLARNYLVLGAFNSAAKELDDDLFKRNENFKYSCLISFMSQYANSSVEVLNDMDRCIRLNFNDLLNDQFWYRLVKSELTGAKNELNYYNLLLFEMKQTTDYKKVESWLKYGIYYNYSDLISDNLGILPSMAILDERLRTLAAYNLYNNAEYTEAQEYVSNVNTFNGNYLKANLETRNNNYELSYAFNKTALKKREHSIYANQLNLSLGWLTNNYKHTRESLNMLVSHGDLKKYQDIFNTTLLYQEGKLYRSSFEIKRLSDSFNGQLPYPGRILATSIYIDNLDENWIESANKACVYYSVVNCWLKMQSTIWKDFSKTFKQQDDLNRKHSVLRNISELVEDKSSEINDSIFINQRDIEELDLVIDPAMGEVDGL